MSAGKEVTLLPPAPPMAQDPCMPHPVQFPLQPAYLPTALPSVPVIVQVRSGPKIKENYNAKLSKILGIIQLVAAAVGIVVGAVGLWLHIDADEQYGYRRWYGTVAYYMAPGFWCATFVILSGSFGICSANRRTQCIIIAHMILAIVGSIFGFIMLAIGLSALGEDAVRLNKMDDYDYDYRGYPYYDYDPQSAAAYEAAAEGTVALSVFFVLVGLVEFVASVWAATLCCRATCCASISLSPTVVSSAPAHVQNHVIIVDNQGRPIDGAQILQVPDGGGQQVAAGQWQIPAWTQNGNGCPPPAY